MTVQEKLTLILKLSGLTQAELALRLGVTFAAFNRWINGKATPRAGAQKKIEELYLEYSGEKHVPQNVLEAKKNLILQKRRTHKNTLKEITDRKDIFDQFLLSLTYHSNRIEGSTLSESETAAILFQNSALPNKSLVEQLEAKNHQTALEYAFDYVGTRKPLHEQFILKLHSILMNAIRADAGAWRRHGVRILGTYIPTANYAKIPALMKKLATAINRKPKDIIEHITSIHSEFEQIHPFADGNGRIGRLLMHAMLLRANLPSAVIKQENKQLYNTYLGKAQLKDDTTLLQDFVCDAVLEGYTILET